MKVGPMKRLWLLFPVVLILASCERTLIYAERTGFKLGISVNDNPGTPVEVNAGLKRTLVGFVPPKEGTQGSGADKTAEGEAVSMFSGFRMEYQDGTAAQPFAGKLNIRTQFASGNAALAVASKPEIVTKIVSVTTSSFKNGKAGAKIRKFWKPDGKTIDTDNQARIQKWMTAAGISNSITFFMRSAVHADFRVKAVEDLGL